MMKHSVIFRNAFMCCCVWLMQACTSNSVEKFAADFIEAVRQNDKTAIEIAYPDAAQAPALLLPADALPVVEGASDGKTVEVRLAPDVSLTVEQDEQGNYHIVSSHGLFDFGAEKKALAKATGWIDEKMTDVENAERLKDTLFVRYLAATVKTELKEKITVKAISELHMENHGATYELEVSNHTAVELPGDGYEVKATLWGFDFDEMESVKTNTVKTYSGKAVPAEGKIRYKIPGDVDFEYESWEPVIELKLSDDQLLSAFFVAKGDEYARYLEKKDQLVALSLDMVGTIGLDNNASFYIDGIMGEGKASFYLGSVEVTRLLKMGSYDAASQQLVVKEYDKNNTYLGDFVGKWADGTYRGTFTNTKGGKVGFDLRQKD